MMLSFLLSYLFSLFGAYVSNRFYLREIFNSLSGVFILSILYNIPNIYIIFFSIIANLGILYLPIRDRVKRTRIVCLFNGIFIVFSYFFFSASDNNPFITLTALFMKYFYLSTEYIPGTDGILAYFGYIFFVPGLRYGPVLSFASYTRWLHLGYSYILSKEQEKEIEKEKDRRKKQDLRELIIIREYYKQIGISAWKFFLCFAYFLVHRRVNAYILNIQNNSNILIFVSLIGAVSEIGKYLFVCRWWSEEICYQASFIPNMGNIDILGIEKATNFAEIFCKWNQYGSEFMHSFIKILPVEIKGMKRETVQYIRTSILSYGHIFLFPSSFSCFLLCSVTLFIISFVPDSVSVKINYFPDIISCFLSSIYSRALFSYFLIPVFFNAEYSIRVWGYLLYAGHLIIIKHMFS